jgi:hypothetical protein
VGQVRCRQLQQTIDALGDDDAEGSVLNTLLDLILTAA